MSETIIGIDEILESVACRPPLLMVDRAIVGGDSIRGIKNVTMNEPHFTGHFPEKPIMPGVLQVAAIIQLARIAAQQEGHLTSGTPFLREATNIKFRKPVGPGDQLLIELEPISKSPTEWVVKGSTSNAEGVTCQAELTLATLADGDIPRPAELSPEPLPVPGGDETGAFDVEGIMNAIPHRFPFLLIDRILAAYKDEEDVGRVVGLKNISFNEPLFRGLPGTQNILPEFLQMEIGAQIGCAYALSRPEYQSKIAFFMSIDSAHFYRPVLPGDQLQIQAEVRVKRGRFGTGHGELFVGQEMVSDISLKFALMDV